MNELTELQFKVTCRIATYSPELVREYHKMISDKVATCIKSCVGEMGVVSPILTEILGKQNDNA